MPDDVDYVIGPTAVPFKYQVTKFSGDTPLNVYNVTYNPQTGYGRCDCPAGSYRHTGSADKHVKMVAEWLKKQQAAK